MNDATRLLAENELKKYDLNAALAIETQLPSFEIRNAGGKVIIAAPDSIELLYGVYDLADTRFLNLDATVLMPPGKSLFRKALPFPPGNRC